MSNIIAYILLLTGSGETTTLAKKLDDFEDITECFTIYGDWDIIARVEVANLSTLTKMVMELRKDRSIRKTCTLVAQTEAMKTTRTLVA